MLNAVFGLINKLIQCPANTFDCETTFDSDAFSSSPKSTRFYHITSLVIFTRFYGSHALCESHAVLVPKLQEYGTIASLIV